MHVCVIWAQAAREMTVMEDSCEITRARAHMWLDLGELWGDEWETDRKFVHHREEPVYIHVEQRAVNK